MPELLQVTRPRDASLIVPVIRRHGPPADAGISVPPEQILIAEHMVGDLEIFYAFDMPGYFQYVSQYDCTNLSLDPGGLRKFSVKNLTKRRAQPEIMQPSDAVVMLGLDGELEASLLLVDSLWPHLARGTPGETIVAVPSRDLLLVSGTEATDGVEALRRAVARRWESAIDRKLLIERKLLLTRSLLVRRDDSWHVFES